MISNAEIIERAEAIANRERWIREGRFWGKHLDVARAELQQPAKKIKKIISKVRRGNSKGGR